MAGWWGRGSCGVGSEGGGEIRELGGKGQWEDWGNEGAIVYCGDR